MKGALHSGNVCSRVMEVSRDPTSRGVDNVVDRAARHTHYRIYESGDPGEVNF